MISREKVVCRSLTLVSPRQGEIFLRLSPLLQTYTYASQERPTLQTQKPDAILHDLQGLLLVLL